MTDSQHYARLEERIEGIRDLLQVHTQQDMSMFTQLLEQIERIDAKMDQLLLWRERQEGERAAMKRASAVMAGVISFIISVGGLLVGYLAK